MKQHSTSTYKWLNIGYFFVSNKIVRQVIHQYG